MFAELSAQQRAVREGTLRAVRINAELRELSFSTCRAPAEHLQTVRRPDSVNYADGAATCEKGGRVVAGYLQQMAEDYQDKFN